MDAWQFLSEAFGELPWQQQPPTERVREDHRATLRVGGLVFQIRRTYQLVTSGTGRGSSYLRWRTEITYPYAPRPLLLILPRNHIAYARIPTGDAEFDKRFRLSGAPPEILRRAFDEPLRKRLLAGAGRWVGQGFQAQDVQVPVFVDPHGFHGELTRSGSSSSRGGGRSRPAPRAARSPRGRRRGSCRTSLSTVRPSC